MPSILGSARRVGGLFLDRADGILSTHFAEVAELADAHV